MSDNLLVPAAEAARRLGGLHRITLTRWDREARPGWPAPVYINKRKYYIETELRAFIEGRARSWQEVAATDPTASASDARLIEHAHRTGESLDRLAAERAEGVA